MSGYGLGGLGLRPPVSSPLSARIEVPTPQLGRPAGWLGGVQQAIQQWGAGLVRQAVLRQQRGGATRTGAEGSGSTAAAATASGVRAGESRAGSAAGPSMATLAASTRQLRQQQQAQTLAFVRLLAGADGGGRPLALPAPPAGPSRMPGGGPAPMATLSRALYLEALGALAAAPGPRPQTGPAAGHAIPPRLALPAPDTRAGQALVPAGPLTLALAQRPALPGGRPAMPAHARGPASPAREGATPMGIGPGLGRPSSSAAAAPATPAEPASQAPAGSEPQVVDGPDDEMAGLPVSTPDRIEEPDEDTLPASAGHDAAPAATDTAALRPAHGQTPGDSAPMPASGMHGPADAAAGSRPLSFEEERDALKAEARQMELQALRDSLQQMRDKMFQTQLQRAAKNIDAFCSIT